MITQITETPSWVWLTIGAALELLLRIIPTSKPYYTILGLLKVLFDKIAPDVSTETTEEEVASLKEVKGRVVNTPKLVKKRKFWKLLAK